MNDMIDMEKIKESLSILKPDGQLFEIRIMKGKQIISGYFTDSDTLEQAFSTVDLRGTNIFYTLNVVNPDCYSREQKDCFRVSKVTTGDKDIDSYQWMLVDLDPVRKTGISSTNEEVTKAYEMAKRVVEYLREREYPAPIMALSGNGIHLLYRIAVKNAPENVNMMERCLKALDQMFSNEDVEIDKKVANPSRISKLYGTTAQKGSSTKDRPHRMARIINKPEKVELVKKELLERLASEYIDDTPTYVNRQSRHSDFDIERWMAEHNIRVARTETWKDTTKYILEECPFDESHKAPDATIIRQPSGAIAFKCFHNSCAGHDWHELRLKYEPDAYDDKRSEEEQRIEDGWKRYKAFNRQREDITYKIEDPKQVNPKDMFLSAKMISSRPKEERICIPTGLIDFDRKVGGLAKGEISLASGLRGAAKSTWLSQIVLTAVDRGFNTLVYSGELRSDRFLNWLYLQAAGKDFVMQSKKYENYYYCKDEVKPQIDEWLDGKFYLYDNKYGSNFRSIATVLRSVIEEFKADFVVIDNMSILDLTDISSGQRTDKWDQQKLFVETLKNLALICNCHIIFVAHPRKAMGFLRFDDVGGSGSLGNLVDTGFIMHRINTDFLNGYKSYFGKPWAGGGNNVLEVVKERETGLQEYFIPLWYEQSTKRLKNDPDERIVYGWDHDGFLSGWIDDGDMPWEE